MYAIFADCASGARELWNTADTLDAAKALGEKVLRDHPVTDCGTGGVRWVEVIGTDVPEPAIPGATYEDDPEAWKGWLAWQDAHTMIGLSREDNGNWQSA